MFTTFLSPAQPASLAGIGASSPEALSYFNDPPVAIRRGVINPSESSLINWTTVRSSLSEIGTIFAGVYAPAFFLTSPQTQITFFPEKGLVNGSQQG